VVELDEETLLRVALYLERHKPVPARGAGVIRPAFQENPFDRAPALEPLLVYRPGATWFVRWPNGSLKWVTETFLRSRGFPVPTQALVAEIEAEGRTVYCWQPEMPSGVSE
jgi:hypothetical protein